MGFSYSIIVGARVSAQLSYFPAYIRQDGKPIQQKVTIPVLVSEYRKKGAPEVKPSTFRLTAWGPVADVFCRHMAVGKKISCIAEMGTYEGKTFDTLGRQKVDIQGQPLSGIKLDNTIIAFEMGEDSAKTIATEIQLGFRPAGWSVAGSPDAAKWSEIVEWRKGLKYVMGQATFGFARVIVTPGVRIVPEGFKNGTIVGGSPANVAQAFGANPGYMQPAPVQPNNGFYTPNQPVQQFNNGYAQPNQAPAPAQPSNGFYVPNNAPVAPVNYATGYPPNQPAPTPQPAVMSAQSYQLPPNTQSFTEANANHTAAVRY